MLEIKLTFKAGTLSIGFDTDNPLQAVAPTYTEGADWSSYTIDIKDFLRGKEGPTGMGINPEICCAEDALFALTSKYHVYSFRLGTITLGAFAYP